MVMQDDSNNLDSLIDEVAREMTGAPPAGGYEGLARRVSVRIQDAEAARTPRVWSRAWLLAPAAACVLVLAAFLLRDVNVRPTRIDDAALVTQPDAAPETPSGLRAQGSGLAEAQPSALSVQPSTLRRQGSGGSDGQPSALSPQPITAETDPDLRPLTTAPIEVASLDVSPLVVAMPIEISTIAIDRIEIAAMR
jgi:hypothetical protein